jgi:hypothetical protein
VVKFVETVEDAAGEDAGVVSGFGSSRYWIVAIMSSDGIQDIDAAR